MNAKTKVIRLFISPQTNVRSTQHDRKLFRIPEDVLIEKYPLLYKRKLRLIRYSEYKKALREEAERVGFELPIDGCWIKFFIPMPKSWKPKKRRQMDFSPHKSRPDASNLHKALEDALKTQDMTVWDYRVSKYWYNSVKGFIEIHMPDVNLTKADIDELIRPITHQDPVIK